jgi:hypothetical protein
MPHRNVLICDLRCTIKGTSKDADATLGLFSATGFTGELTAEATVSEGKILLATLDDFYRRPS